MPEPLGKPAGALGAVISTTGEGDIVELRAQIEILERGPLRGRITVEGTDPREFHGWAELRGYLSGEPAAIDAELSEQEKRVASLAAEGLSNAAIADRLSLSARTVQWHLNKAFKKVGVRSRTELAVRLLNDS